LTVKEYSTILGPIVIGLVIS